MALLIAAAAVLGGCGSKPSVPDIATLASAAPPAAGQKAGQGATQGGGNEQGIRLRLDSTDEERIHLIEQYQECLFQHGVKEKKVDGPVPAGTEKRQLDTSGEPKSAYLACAAKKPLKPVELDENANPNFAAQWEDNVRCLRTHGLMVHTTKPGEWTYDNSYTKLPDNDVQLERDCLLEVFGGKKN
jgi:hypothetical protein